MIPPLTSLIRLHTPHHPHRVLGLKPRGGSGGGARNVDIGLGDVRVTQKDVKKLG
jgi:hypothetical protein